MMEDLSIIPYFTPCEGHRIKAQSTPSQSEDQIDGVLQMQAYCVQCKNNSDGS